MKISISNIAWDKSQDRNVLEVLKEKNISAIEVAPTKIWKTPNKISMTEAKEYRNFWNKNGIEIVAIQSILFGHPELKLFEDKETRKKTLRYISKIIALSSNLGAKIMVFGSPKNRNIRTMKMRDALKIGAEFFFEIGEISKEFGIIFCIEPNPKEYETNFINNTDEALNFVRKVNHPNFRIHLDLSTLTINKETYRLSILKASPLLSHFHVSNPYLQPVKVDSKHKTVSQALREIEYKGYVSIEMLSQKLIDISNALDIEKYYG